METTLRLYLGDSGFYHLDSVFRHDLYITDICRRLLTAVVVCTDKLYMCILQRELAGNGEYIWIILEETNNII